MIEWQLPDDLRMGQVAPVDEDRIRWILEANSWGCLNTHDVMDLVKEVRALKTERDTFAFRLCRLEDREGDTEVIRP